jgi:hypothetical protein
MNGLYTRASDGLRVTVMDSWTPDRLNVCPWDGPCYSRTLAEVSDLIITRNLIPDAPAICPHGLDENADCFDCRWAA